MPQQSSKFPDCFYRVTIKGLCVRDGKLLMVKESASLSGHWELPGGGLDFGEDIYLGMARETEEEMGLPLAKMSHAPVYVWTHKYEKKRDLSWFYSCVLAYRIDFDHLDFTPSEECEAIEFFSAKELHDLGLSGQMTPLPDVFRLEDFNEEF